ncbi:MAG: nucleoside monophosphate kinase [Candidatus Doudnabacteria bacterium]|nr:nucleoside monophosphate kinase [Candidatus Doudnabacteria bacterium]
MKKLRIIMLGRPGSGKGTQADLLAVKYNIAYIGMGAMLREEIKKDTAIGKLIAPALSKGILIPEKITDELIKKRLQKQDCKKGYLLDGYPRNLAQARFLETITKVNFVFDIVIEDDAVIERLGGRLSCYCGEVYHIDTKPPRSDNKCDKCGKKLYARKDDNPKVIKHRLKVYHRQTEPLIKLYQSQGVLYRVNGNRAIEEIFEDIVRIIKKARKQENKKTI